jgi:predicted esterase
MIGGESPFVIKSPSGAALCPVFSSPARFHRGDDDRSPAVVVLVLHGGSADSSAPTRWRNLAILRLWPVAREIARKVPHASVYRLRFAVRGWNGDGSAALRDARWAMTVVQREHPGAPIVVVGHSMGGRVALHIGGDVGVAGIVLLAPWAPSDEPAEQLADVPVVVVQGGRDRVIPEPTTRPWISRAEHAGARVHRSLLPWAGHAMLRRFWVWHRLAADGVLTVLAESRVIAEDQSVSD